MAANSDVPPTGVALIGSGLFAQREHLPAILATPTLSLKAVYSRTLKSAAELTANLAQKVDFYTDETEAEARGYDDLLKNSNIKAVIIALPILAQPAYIRKALDAGKHVLSEKPIAPDSKTARDLIEWYGAEKHKTGVTWSIAENWRFMDSHVFAAHKVRELGRVLGFRIRRSSMVNPGFAYFETQWRKHPGYQGGFLLDGGIHVVAAARMILGDADEFTRISAFTTQLQPHLPPVDTVNATVKTRSGASGTFAVSSGTTFKGSGFSIACEGGTVTVLRSRVVVERDGEEVAQDFPDEGSGVKQELGSWSSDIMSGKQDPRFSPDEALRDLDALEAMLRSGENDGAPFNVPP